MKTEKKIGPLKQNIVNDLLLILFLGVLWWILEPVRFLDGETILKNTEFIFMIFLIIMFFEFEFWSGIKRLLNKDPGKFFPGTIATLLFFLVVAPRLGIFDFLLKGGTVVLILWMIFFMFGPLYAVNRSHWLTLLVFGIMTIVEAFDPSMTLAGGILGNTAFFIFFGIEKFINNRNTMNALGISLVLGSAIAFPSVILQVALIIIMAIHKSFTPIDFKKKGVKQ